MLPHVGARSSVAVVCASWGSAEKVTPFADALGNVDERRCALVILEDRKRRGDVLQRAGRIVKCWDSGEMPDGAFVRERKC